MSFRAAGFAPASCLSGSDGELVQVRVSTEPRRLEELLEALAAMPFPINPQLYHGVPTTVEFPAYCNQLDEVRSILKACSFEPDAIQVNSMIEALTA